MKTLFNLVWLIFRLFMGLILLGAIIGFGFTCFGIGASRAAEISYATDEEPATGVFVAGVNDDDRLKVYKTTTFTITVEEGDTLCLWEIANQVDEKLRAPYHATWQELYEKNREVVGANLYLIPPNTVLKFSIWSLYYPVIKTQNKTFAFPNVRYF